MLKEKLKSAGKQHHPIQLAQMLGKAGFVSELVHGPRWRDTYPFLPDVSFKDAARQVLNSFGNLSNVLSPVVSCK
jgi:hypothetical protein